MVAEETVIELQ